MVLKCPFCNETVKAGLVDCPACVERMVRSCPACSESVSVKARDCKYCGQALGKERPKARRATPVAAPAPVAKPTPDIEFVDDAPRAAIPWEDTSRGFLHRWWATWLRSQVTPATFFSRMPATGGHRWPIGYAFGLAAQALVLAFLGGTVALAFGLTTQQEISNTDVWAGAGALVLAIPASFLGVTVLLYATSLLWHGLLKLLGGKAGFEGTLRIVGYSSHIHLWNVIPVLGTLVAAVNWFRLHYHGFRKVHGLSAFRALFATAFPFLLMAGALVAMVAACCACDASAGPAIENF